MDRTSNAPRGSRDWESWDFSARMLVEMYSQGLYGLDVDFDEAARLIELLRSRGADVRDLSARVGALQRGHALVHQGSQLLLDDDPDDALSVFRSATDTGYIRARVIRNALLAFSTDNSLRQEFYDSYYRQLGTSEPHHRVEHFLLGVVQISGTEQVEARTDFALFRFHAAAKLGHARSMFLLGQAFEAGDGVNADYDEARCWYGRAIESFNSEEIVPDYSIGSDARAGLARLSLHE
jgi:TPR repeat protein